jgi:hypothetical protein
VQDDAVYEVQLAQDNEVRGRPRPAQGILPQLREQLFGCYFWRFCSFWPEKPSRVRGWDLPEARLQSDEVSDWGDAMLEIFDISFDDRGQVAAMRGRFVPSVS